MFKISSIAGKKIREAFDQALTSNYIIRLGVRKESEDDLTYEFESIDLDEIESTDLIMESENIKIVVNQKLIEHFHSVVLNYRSMDGQNIFYFSKFIRGLKD